MSKPYKTREQLRIQRRNERFSLPSCRHQSTHTYGWLGWLLLAATITYGVCQVTAPAASASTPAGSQQKTVTKCATLSGLPICDLPETHKWPEKKASKPIKVECYPTDKVEQVDGCQAPEFFTDETGASINRELDLSGKPLYTECKRVYKCHKAK